MSFVSSGAISFVVSSSGFLWWMFTDLSDLFHVCEVGEIETCCQYSHHFSNYSTERVVPLNSIRNISSSILQKMILI